MNIFVMTPKRSLGGQHLSLILNPSHHQNSWHVLSLLLLLLFPPQVHVGVSVSTMLRIYIYILLLCNAFALLYYSMFNPTGTSYLSATQSSMVVYRMQCNMRCMRVVKALPHHRPMLRSLHSLICILILSCCSVVHGPPVSLVG